MVAPEVAPPTDDEALPADACTYLKLQQPHIKAHLACLQLRKDCTGLEQTNLLDEDVISFAKPARRPPLFGLMRNSNSGKGNTSSCPSTVSGSNRQACSASRHNSISPQSSSACAAPAQPLVTSYVTMPSAQESPPASCEEGSTAMQLKPVATDRPSESASSGSIEYMQASAGYSCAMEVPQQTPSSPACKDGSACSGGSSDRGVGSATVLELPKEQQCHDSSKIAAGLPHVPKTVLTKQLEWFTSAMTAWGSSIRHTPATIQQPGLSHGHDSSSSSNGDCSLDSSDTPATNQGDDNNRSSSSSAILPCRWRLKDPVLVLSNASVFWQQQQVQQQDRQYYMGQPPSVDNCSQVMCPAQSAAGLGPVRFSSFSQKMFETGTLHSCSCCPGSNNSSNIWGHASSCPVGLQEISSLIDSSSCRLCLIPLSTCFAKTDFSEAPDSPQSDSVSEPASLGSAQSVSELSESMLDLGDLQREDLLALLEQPEPKIQPEPWRGIVYTPLIAAYSPEIVPAAPNESLESGLSNISVSKTAEVPSSSIPSQQPCHVTTVKSPIWEKPPAKPRNTAWPPAQAAQPSVAPAAAGPAAVAACGNANVVDHFTAALLGLNSKLERLAERMEGLWRQLPSMAMRIRLKYLNRLTLDHEAQQIIRAAGCYSFVLPCHWQLNALAVQQQRKLRVLLVPQ